MDVWNPETFNTALAKTLTRHSNLVCKYYAEEKRLMDEHLNSDPYQSLKPNEYKGEFLSLLERIVTPLLREQRIRVWHYTRLLDEEVSQFKTKMELSTLSSLSLRLERLKRHGLLTPQETQMVFDQSPLHEQNNSRADRLWTTTLPFSPSDPGVVPLLENWGGEAAYFWLSNETIAAKLKCIGTPQVIEIETELRDNFNAYGAAETAVQAWAKYKGVPVNVMGRDLAILDCLGSAKVLEIHTAGDQTFSKVATEYPSGCGQLLGI